jgi:choline-glycine betaine transporter
MKAQLGGGEFAEAFVASIQFQWGLIILFGGVVMLIACALLASSSAGRARLRPDSRGN